MPSARERWFAEVLHAGLDTKLATEQDVLAHATPAVLIASLPKDVLARVLGGALTANAMSPKSIVETVSLELLAEKVAPAVIWACIAKIADRAGIRSGNPTDNTNARELIRRTLASSLSTGVLAPKDVVEHVDAEVLATCFPDDVTTKLLEASLAAGKLDPELIIETIGVATIAKHAPVEVVWACFVKPGEATTVTTAKPVAPQSGKPAIELVEDEVSVIFADIDEDLKKETKKDKAAAVSAKPA